MGDFDEVVQAQFGLLTRLQGVDFFGRGPFERRVHRGDFLRFLHGVYRAAGAPASAEQSVFAATLAYGGPTSHRGAAALRGFDRYVELRSEVTVIGRSGSRKRSVGKAITLHRTNFLPSSHIELVRGIPATTAARTLCDLSVFLSSPSLGRLLDDAKRRGLVSYEAVAACRDEMRARGRRRTSVIDELLEFRGLGFDPGDSAPELNLRSWLEDAGLHPATQYPVIIAGKKRFLDLAYPAPKVAVEYLGIDPHALATRVVDDSQRTTELQLAGWLVVLITKGTTRWRAVQMVREAIALRGEL